MNRLPSNISNANGLKLNVPRIELCGDHRYDNIIRESDGAVSALSELLEQFEGDFVGACQILSPSTWRLIYYMHDLSFTRLLDPSFAPVAHLTSQVTLSLLSDLPERFARCENLLHATSQLRLELHEISSDETKAVWATTSFLKLLAPETADVASVEWWDPDYLRVLVNSCSQV